MSRFGAARAASAHVPVPVVSRETLFTGAVVKTKIPVGATKGSYPRGEERVPFLQFCTGFRGGRVNFFVHTTAPTCCGKTIVAAASVLKKTLEDGREFIYVDLVPVDDDTPITHRIAVMPNIEGSWAADGHQVFATPAPLEGVIIFAPPEAKIVAY